MKQTRTIEGWSSLILDTIRICAAITVVIYHAYDHKSPSYLNLTSPLGKGAHAAVVVFFVLSGYVIAHTTTNNNRGALKYFHARFSRLFSVVIPVLIITAVIQIIVQTTNPILQNTLSRGPSWPRYILTGSFLNEIWFFSAAPPINTPFWSLGFEFWYYIIFGLWFFGKKNIFNLNLPVLIALIVAGPKIIIMLPIWLLGYNAYCLPANMIETRIRWFLVIIGFTIAILSTAYLKAFPAVTGTLPLIFASQFITDWIVGLFVAIALWALPPSKTDILSVKIMRAFRYIADLTFSVYLLHFPLLVLWSTILGFSTDLLFTASILSVLFISFFLGSIIEKQRVIWISMFGWIFDPKRKYFLMFYNNYKN